MLETYSKLKEYVEEQYKKSHVVLYSRDDILDLIDLARDIGQEEGHEMGFREALSDGAQEISLEDLPDHIYDAVRDDIWHEAYGEGRDNGYQEGSDDGYQEGYDEGMRDGKEEGINLGREEGYAQGHDDGYQEGYDECRIELEE